MKYHSLLTSDPGINSLSTNPCKLLDFNLLKLGAGEIHEGAHARGVAQIGVRELVQRRAAAQPREIEHVANHA